jgi:translation initiation factor 1
VYTTESGRVCPECGKPVDACGCKKKTARAASAPAQHAPPPGTVRVSIEKKGRGGKTVSIIAGLPLHREEDLKQLAAELKRRCGSGGAIKDGVIEIQGDHRDVLVVILQSKGYTAKRAGG